MVNTSKNTKHLKNISHRITRQIDTTIQHILSSIERWLKLKIKGKLGVAFVGFSSIPMVIVGTILWYMNMQSMRSNATAELSHISEVISIRLKEFTEVIQTDLELVNTNFTATMKDNDNPQNSNKSMALFKDQLQNLMKTKPHYYRLTFLVDSLQSQLFSFKREIHNRNYIDQTESDQSWNYYRLLVEDLHHNQMRIIPVELLDRKSKETLAALSVALPYRNPQEKLTGIFVADIFADYFFNLIETSLSEEARHTAGIVDQEGHYLYHSQKKNEWNRLLAEISLFTLDKEFSPEIANQIIDQSSGLLETNKGDVVYHAPLEMGALSLQKKYYFYLLEPGSIIFSRLRQFGLIFLIAMASFVIIAIYLSRIATLQFVGPIRQLQQGSDIISRGNFSHRLKIKTGDEIQEMADRFNYMAQSIEERDQQLKEINTNLEGKISERTLELQDEKDKLRIILDNVPNAFVLFDNNQIVISASSALKQFTGYSPQEAVGKKCFKIMNTISDCTKCKKERLTKKHMIYREEFQKFNDNGDEILYERVNIPVELVSGEDACLEIFSDITNQVRLQNQLLQSEKLASTGEMAAVIAHEIRNLLTSTDMLLQLLQESDSLEATEKESLDVVLNATSRINKITEDLLSFARPTTVNKQPIKFSDLIRECMKLYKHQFKNHNIHTELDIPKNLPRIQIDYNLMSEAVSNILLNTYQALGNNGNVKISVQYFKTQNDFKKFVNITEIKQSLQNADKLERTDGIVMLTIIDDGPGIPKKNLLKIFDPFYTTKINGTGLGLSMARRVVETHNGIIFASSEEPHSTTITMIIPSRN